MKRLLMTAIMAVLMAQPCLADDGVEVPLGGAALVRLGAAARRVVVGNPAIADVTVDSPRLISVFGKFPGGTTLAVLDGGGHVLLEVPVVVMPGGAGSVVVSYGTSKNEKLSGHSQVYECSSQRCTTATALPGDSPFKVK
jgi:hypothetical protein